MPSKLLNIIRKIDDSRLNLLNVFEMKKYPVDKHTTLSVLSNFAAQGLKEYNTVDPNENLIGGIQYYDNPEDDPEVWTEYKKWPDLYAAYKASEIHDFGSISPYAPVAAILVRCDGLSSFQWYSNYNNSNPTDGLLNTYGVGLNVRSIKTNTFYEVSSTAITINSDEFITGEDGHTYFGAVFYYGTKNSSATLTSQRFYAGAGLEIKEIIIDPTLLQNTQTATQNIGAFTIGTREQDTLEAVRFVWSPVPKESFNWTNRTIESYQYTPRISVPTTNNLKLIQIDLPEFETQKRNNTEAPIGAFKTGTYSSTFNTLINNNRYIGTSLWIPQHVRYIKTPSISTRVDWVTIYSRKSHSPWLCNLKYLEITDEEAHRDYSNRINYLFPFTATHGTSGYGGECMFPFLRDTQLVKYCTEYKRVRIFRGSFNNMETASFEFETFPDYFRANATKKSTYCSQFFEFLNAKEVIITKLKEFSVCYLNLNTTIERVILPDVETLWASGYGINRNPTTTQSQNTEIFIKEFILPNLTSIENLYPGTDDSTYAFESPTLLKFSATKLTTIVNPNMFSYLPMLETLELGDGFESTISLEYSLHLSKESILDLFNKLKTLTEEEITEGRTITLPKYGDNVIANFTAEELAIATDKGWVVN